MKFLFKCLLKNLICFEDLKTVNLLISCVSSKRHASHRCLLSFTQVSLRRQKEVLLFRGNDRCCSHTCTPEANGNLRAEINYSY